MEDEWEEEEQLVVVELSGVISNDFLSKCRGTCNILDIDGDKPMMQVGPYVFVGEYEDALGTCVLFEEESLNGDTEESATDLTYKGHTVKRLKMQRIFLREKKDEETAAGPEQKDVSDSVEVKEPLDCHPEGQHSESPGKSSQDSTAE